MEARGEGAAAGVSAFGGRRGARSAGRRDPAGAKVAARRSAPPAGRVGVGDPGLAPPSLLPAAFWRVSPLQSPGHRASGRGSGAGSSCWRD